MIDSPSQELGGQQGRCRYCGAEKVFPFEPWLDDLKKHRRQPNPAVAVAEPPPVEPEPFDLMGSFRELAAMHADEPPMPRCKVCGRPAMSEHGLAVHMGRQHKTGYGWQAPPEPGPEPTEEPMEIAPGHPTNDEWANVKDAIAEKRYLGPPLPDAPPTEVVLAYHEHLSDYIGILLDHLRNGYSSELADRIEWVLAIPRSRNGEL